MEGAYEGWCGVTMLVWAAATATSTVLLLVESSLLETDVLVELANVELE